MKVLVSVGLSSIFILHFVAITTGNWYGLHVNINRCLSCGKLILTFGEFLENMTRLNEDSENILKDSATEFENVGNLHFKFEEMRPNDQQRRMHLRDSDDRGIANSVEWSERETLDRDSDDHEDALGDLKFVHDLTHPDYEQDGADIVEEFIIENYITVHVGLVKTRLCSEQNICADFDVTSSKFAFESLKYLQMTQAIIPWIKACISMSTLVLMITIVCSIFDDNSSDLIISGLTMYSIISLIATVTASIPYFTTTSYDVITLCVPWAHVLTTVTAYISAVIAYHLKSNKQWMAEQKMPRWPMRSMKLV